MNYREKQAYAKTLKVNSFGMKEDELDAAIAEAEASGVVPEEKPVSVTSDLAPEPPKPRAKDAPPAIDNATLIAMRAADMAREALEKLSAAQQSKKSETPEAVINQQHATDSSVIKNMEKVPITIPGGYVGAPKRVSYCVNGHRGSIKAGEENVMVPRAVAEVLVRSRKLTQQNMERNKKLENDAINAGV
jgi:hypothetical protein